MKLKEKFKKTLQKNFTINEIEQIADDFAIGFAEWVECSKTYYTPMKELLEIYKKEKGL